MMNKYCKRSFSISNSAYLNNCEWVSGKHPNSLDIVKMNTFQAINNTLDLALRHDKNSGIFIFLKF